MPETISINDYISAGQWHVTYWTDVDKHIVIVAYDLTTRTRIIDLPIPEYHKQLKLEPIRVSQL